MNGTIRSALAAVLLLAVANAAAEPTVITFDDGAPDWNGNAMVESDGGNPGVNAHFLIENFGIELRTDTHPAFVGDFGTSESVTVGLDTKIDSITFKGSEVSREMIVEFRSRALAQDGYPYTSVWYDLGTIQAGPDWLSLSVTVDPRSEALPAGWGGYGAEDPETFEPILPPGVTFADVMASVDEVAFTTFEPGYFYGFTIFDVRYDNLRIERSGPSDLVFADGFELP